MEKSTNQIEKNVSASFAYVKKDMLMLNDAFSDMHDKLQQLKLEHSMLSEEVKKLKNELSKTSKESEIRHLSINHEVLLEEIEKLRGEVVKLVNSYSEKKSLAKKVVKKKK